MNKFVCVLLCTLLTVGCKDDKTNSDNQGHRARPDRSHASRRRSDRRSGSPVVDVGRRPRQNHRTRRELRNARNPRRKNSGHFLLPVAGMPLVRHRIADLHGRRSEAVRNRCGKSLRHPEAAQCESDRSGTGARKHFPSLGRTLHGVLRIRRRMGHPQTRPDAQRCRRRRGAVRRNQRIHLPRRSQKGRRRLYGDAQRRLSNAPIRVRCALRRI